MPNLQGTRDDATSQPVILKRHGNLALEFAEDVKSEESVPGSTNNDIDSWRRYLRGAIFLNAFEATNQDRGLGASDNGKVYFVSTGTSTRTIVTPSNIGEGFTFCVIKADSASGSVVITENGTVQATLTKQYESVTLMRSDRGWVVVSEVGRIGSVSKQSILDSLLVEGLIDVVNDDEDLPDVANYDDNQILLHQGELWHRKTSPREISFAFVSGSRTFSGVTYRGIQSGAYGRWTTNPESNFSAFFDTGHQIELLVNRNAYRRSKGSNEAAGDRLSATIITDEDTPRTATIELVYRGTGVGNDLAFTGPRTGVPLDSNSNGHTVTVELERNNADFMVVSSNALAHWVVYDLAHSQRNAQDIEELKAEILSDDGSVNQKLNGLDARLQQTEDKTSGITFDSDPLWESEPNTAVNGKHPYGGWFWVPRGGNASSYASSNYNNYIHAPRAEGAGPGRGLIWVLPNNINWSRVRLVVFRADNSIRSIITGQSLRNAPASVRVSNLPTSPPDVTVRWSAESDTHPYATTNFQQGDTVLLQVLANEHTPIWNGEYADESIPQSALASGVSFPIKNVEQLASLRSRNRGNLNGADTWEVDSTSLGGNNAITTSGRELFLDSRAVVKSNTLGLIVLVLRGTPEEIVSRVFVPWSAFRSRDSDYVSGGSLVASQGHFLGHWSDNSNSVMWGSLTWSNGNLGFQISGPSADNSSRLTVYSAA